MKKRFNPVVESALLESGWFSGRRVISIVEEWKNDIKKSDSIEIFPKAEEILLEFGGLRIQPLNPSENVYSLPIEIDPLLVEMDRFIDFSKDIRMQIYPMGENYNGHFYLGVSEDGKIYELMQNLFLVGNNIDEALSSLVLGKDSRLIL